MRIKILAAAAAFCSLIIAPVHAGQLKFDPATFKIYGGMGNGQTASLITPHETPETSREIIDFFEPMEPGSILIRTDERRLYFVLPGNKAIMYPVGVGREGFTWSGQDQITRKAIWPDWRPPKDMIEREAQEGSRYSSLRGGRSRKPVGRPSPLHWRNGIPHSWHNPALEHWRGGFLGLHSHDER